MAALAWPRSMAAWKGERWTGRGRLSGSGSGGGGLLHSRCLCVPLRDHAPPGCHLRSVSGLSSKPGRLVQSWGQVGSCRSRVDLGKRRKPRLRFIAKGTRELSSCHQNIALSYDRDRPLLSVPKALGYLILWFRTWSVGLWEVALPGMALGEKCARFGPQLPHA